MKTKQLEDKRDAIQEKICTSYVLGSQTVCVWNWWTAPAGSVPGTTPRFSAASPPARCSGHSETANPSRLAGIDETSATNTELVSCTISCCEDCPHKKKCGALKIIEYMQTIHFTCVISCVVISMACSSSLLSSSVGRFICLSWSKARSFIFCRTRVISYWIWNDG